MAIISQNHHDAFLSYARDDDFRYAQAITTFASRLKRSFEVEMRLCLEPPPPDLASDIFIDKDGLPANGELSQELAKAINDSAFLFIFIGLSYPRSEWCGKELKVFSERFKGDRSRALERTFLIVLERQAVGAKWGEYLEQPSRPIYESFFSEHDGKLIHPIIEDEGQAKPNPNFTKRLRHVTETMVARALPLMNVEQHRSDGP